MENPFGVNNQTFFYGAYGLLCATIWFESPMFAVAGAIFVYYYRQNFAGSIYQDHTAYVIRTVIGFVILSLLADFIGFGGLIYLVSIVWFIFRSIYGLVKVWKEQPVTPTSWLI